TPPGRSSTKLAWTTWAPTEAPTTACTSATRTASASNCTERISASSRASCSSSNVRRSAGPLLPVPQEPARDRVIAALLRDQQPAGQVQRDAAQVQRDAAEEGQAGEARDGKNGERDADDRD